MNKLNLYATLVLIASICFRIYEDTVTLNENNYSLIYITAALAISVLCRKILYYIYLFSIPKIIFIFTFCVATLWFLFKKIFTSKSVNKPSIYIEQRAHDFDECYDIVGESFYIDNLRKLFKSNVYTKGQWQFKDCIASLVPEPENQHDRNAIAVYIDDLKVGHIGVDHTEDLQPFLLDKNVTCRAKMVKNIDFDNIGVKLMFDIDSLPERLQYTE